MAGRPFFIGMEKQAFDHAVCSALTRRTTCLQLASRLHKPDRRLATSAWPPSPSVQLSCFFDICSLNPAAPSFFSYHCSHCICTFVPASC